MKKLIYKRNYSWLIVAGLLLATNAGAIGGNGAGTGASSEGDANSAKPADVAQKIIDKKAQAGANICDKISERADAFSQKMVGEENKLQTRNQERLNNWTDKKAEKETKLNSQRATWDANRDAQFKALEERAQTEEQKKAVADFETKVRAAIETRRTAMDSASKTFETGVQAQIATRKGQVDQLLTNAKTARQKLLDSVKTDCAAGKDPKTVLATFHSGMQANRVATQTDKQNIAKINAQIQALIATRKSAVEKAFADFKATMEQARIELKKAFPVEK